MLPEQHRWIEEQFEPEEGDPWLLAQIARDLEAEGNLDGAATVYDRAFGIAPEVEKIRQERQAVLERLRVVEHGIVFRYIPAGPFLMGSPEGVGEPDEHPRHPVWLDAFWLAETPMSWTAYCRLMGWEPPPAGFPRQEDELGGVQMAGFHLNEANKIRLQYCEDQTTRAQDWHAHAPGQMWQSGTGQAQTAQELFGHPRRNDPEAPWEYDTKPMVAISWQEALALADRLSTATARYTLPTEAQWEKAARGGLIGALYPWGNEAPTPEVCDFNRFATFSILPMRTFAANGYGLYAMSGGVWEWTRDWYDQESYRHSVDRNPEGPSTGEEKALRGGSWSDCAEAVTVTFRMSRGSTSWRDGRWGANLTPNIGFRLCRLRHGVTPASGGEPPAAGQRNVPAGG